MSDIILHEGSSQLATKDQFLSNFAPGKCLRLYSKVDSPALAMQSEAPTLASIRKNYSEDFQIAFTAVWIVNLNDFINAKRKMTPVQIEETATMIVQDYPYFNLADINLVFRKIKKGEFGELFAELDGVKILSWFEAYSQERARTAADQSMSNSESFKKEGEDLPRLSDRSSEKSKNQQAIGLRIQQLAKDTSK